MLTNVTLMCRHWGRRATMLLAGASFLAGVVLCTTAVALGMLIVGRIFLGFGVGFANQAVPFSLLQSCSFPGLLSCASTRP